MADSDSLKCKNAVDTDRTYSESSLHPATDRNNQETGDCRGEVIHHQEQGTNRVHEESVYGGNSGHRDDGDIEERVLKMRREEVRDELENREERNEPQNEKEKTDEEDGWNLWWIQDSRWQAQTKLGFWIKGQRR